MDSYFPLNVKKKQLFFDLLVLNLKLKIKTKFNQIKTTEHRNCFTSSCPKEKETKVASACNFIKEETLGQVFSCEFLQNF